MTTRETLSRDPERYEYAYEYWCEEPGNEDKTRAAFDQFLRDLEEDEI